MVIKVEVDLKDFYEQGEEASFNELIKDDIANKVRNIIWSDFKTNAFESFSNQVVKQISLDKDLKIKETLDYIFKTKKIKKQYSGNEMITCEEYIQDALDREYFNNNNMFQSKISDAITKQSTEITKQLKERYDLLFASQIVAKLNEQGMLKDDVAKILLG